MDGKKLFLQTFVYFYNHLIRRFSIFLLKVYYENTIISTNVSDIKDIIGNNYIVPFNDYNKFNEKINMLKIIMMRF